MKTTPLSLIFTGLLATAAITACGDKDDEDDTGGAGTTDTDTDTDTDTTVTDDTGTVISTYFEPSSLLFEVRHGLSEGAMSTVTSAGTPIDAYFAIWLTNDDWGGFDDTRNFCALFYDISTAELADDCTVAGDKKADGSADTNEDPCWAAFKVVEPVAIGAAGECDDLDPEVWGEDVLSDFGTGTYGWGFAPMGSEMASSVQTNYADYWADYGTKFAATVIYTDLTGSPTWWELNTAFVYETDEAGELTVEGDGNVLLDVVPDPGYALDGFYSSSFYYGFTLGG